MGFVVIYYSDRQTEFFFSYNKIYWRNLWTVWQISSVYVWFSHNSDLTQLISRIKFRHFLLIIHSPMFDIQSTKTGEKCETTDATKYQFHVERFCNQCTSSVECQWEPNIEQKWSDALVWIHDSREYYVSKNCWNIQFSTFGMNEIQNISEICEWSEQNKSCIFYIYISFALTWNSIRIIRWYTTIRIIKRNEISCLKNSNSVYQNQFLMHHHRRHTYTLTHTRTLTFQEKLGRWTEAINM